MKFLITYFSRSGHNKKIANDFASSASCDIYEIIDKKPRGYIMSGFGALHKKKTEINPIEQDLKKYDFIILASPFWAGGVPPATRTFIEQYLQKIKRFGFLSVSGGGEKNTSYLDTLEKEYTLDISPRLLVSDTDFVNKNYQGKLNEFIELIK